jgi:hypothetical protein
VHEHRLAVDRQKLFGDIAFHAAPTAAGHNDDVFLHWFRANKKMVIYGSGRRSLIINDHWVVGLYIK